MPRPGAAAFRPVILSRPFFAFALATLFLPDSFPNKNSVTLMNLTIKFLPLVAATFWFGCSNPADHVPAAAVSAASASTSAEPADAEGTYFVFGPENGVIEFIGSKVTGSHDGGFKNFHGEFKVVNGRLADSGNKVVIDTTSIWSDNNRLTAHLKTPDFFDVEQYPTATFTTTSVKHAGANSTVTGNLTMHGITKTISFPASVEIKANEVHITSEFSLNRFDFEMKFPGRADDLIRNEVVLKLNIKAVPGRANFAAADSTPRWLAAGN
jgi:polyisoprenoid-binding protein YceI